MADFGTQPALLLALTEFDTDTDHSQLVRGDEEFDSRQDQAAMEAAIADYLSQTPRSSGNLGYSDLDAVLSRLPVPRKLGQREVSVTAAVEAGMLPRM